MSRKLAKKKYSIQREMLSQREYGNIKLALKRTYRDPANIGEDINIKLIKDNTRQGKWQSISLSGKNETSTESL